MRQTFCPICRRTEFELVYRSSLPTTFDEAHPPGPYTAHYQIGRCRDCELMRSNPIMDEMGVTALYLNSSETNVTVGEEENVRLTMRGYYELARPYLPAKERILDIGCDMGFLLNVAKADGFTELCGTEPTPVARRTAEKIAGSNISAEFYEQANYAQSSFDLITMIHVLDHLYDPSIVLKRAISDLKPGGVIVAVVHNVNSILGKILGEKFPIFNLYHHYFFSKSTLGRLFESQGFDVIKVVSTKNCYSLGFFAERNPFLPKRIRRYLHNFLKILKVDEFPVTIPVGNIGIVARRPALSPPI